MIIDMHSHVFPSEYLSEKNQGWAASADEHYKGTSKADKVIVFGMYAPFCGILVPNNYIAEYLKRDPDRLIGFMSVDPGDKNCIEEIERSKKDLGLKGIKLGPMYQDFHPSDRKLAYPVYEKAQELNLPIIFHMGTTSIRETRLRYTLPISIEDIAHDFPNLKMVIAHLGSPWEADTIVLIRKQPNVYADIAALYYRPWQFYNSLRLATEYKVMDKLLFGSDFPATTVEDTIKGLFDICDLADRAKLPPIQREDVLAIINRNSLKLLGIE